MIPFLGFLESYCIRFGLGLRMAFFRYEPIAFFVFLTRTVFPAIAGHWQAARHTQWLGYCSCRKMMRSLRHTSQFIHVLVSIARGSTRSPFLAPAFRVLLLAAEAIAHALIPFTQIK